MFLWCVGGPEVGSRILNHPKVDSWMMTGFERNHLFFFVVFFIALFSGCATFDAIVWGGKAAKESKNRKQLLSKTCHAELGAASPYIISPGNWTDQELDQQATLLAGYKMLNSGHVCASPQSLPSFIVFFFFVQKLSFSLSCRRGSSVASRSALLRCSGAKAEGFPIAQAVSEKKRAKGIWLLMFGYF